MTLAMLEHTEWWIVMCAVNDEGGEDQASEIFGVTRRSLLDAIYPGTTPDVLAKIRSRLSQVRDPKLKKKGRKK
jgi:hypothetical protein